MLQLIEPEQKEIQDVEFSNHFKNQKRGLEMLYTLNKTDRDYLIGPDVDDYRKIVVIKDAPKFLFNPELEPETGFKR